MTPSVRLPLIAVLALSACDDEPPSVHLNAAGDPLVYLTDSLWTDLGSQLPTDAPEPPLERDGLLFEPALILSDTALADEPMNVAFAVIVSNPTPSDARLAVQGCTVWPELFADVERTRSVWQPAGDCMQAPHEIDVAGGGQHTLFFGAHGAMLSGAVEDGRYYATLDLQLADTTLRFDAGMLDVRLRTPGLAFHVDADDTGNHLSAAVAVENRNAQPVHLEYGACSLTFVAHRSARLDDSAVRLGPNRLCLDYLAISMIQPGDTLHATEFEHSIDVDDIEAEPGTYVLAAHLTVNWRVWRLRLGNVTVH